jgi:hypothetical protein
MRQLAAEKYSSSFHFRIFWLCGMVMLACMAVLAIANDAHELIGKLDSRIPIRITLQRNGKNLSGIYQYFKVGKDITLKGEINLENEFTLQEFDERNRHTGTFRGKYVTAEWIDGFWSSPDKRKNLKFEAWDEDGMLVPAINPNDSISGSYLRWNNTKGQEDTNNATLNLRMMKDGRIRIDGNAIWEGNAETGNVNTGEVDAFCMLKNKEIIYQGKGHDLCRFVIALGKDSLVVSNDNMKCGGLNVTFNGSYKKVPR